MTLAELGAIGEFVGSIAVLFSLIYLALQIRQNTKSNLINAKLEAMKVQTEFFDTLLFHGDTDELYSRGNQDYLSLSEADKRRYSIIVAKMCSAQTTMVYMHKSGMFEADTWQEYERNMRRTHSRPGFQQWWQEQARERFSDDFIAFAEDLVAGHQQS